MAKKTSKQLAREIIDATYKQGVADNEAQRVETIKEMSQNAQNHVARTGMNWSSLAGTMSTEGEAKINAAAMRNKNMLDINRSQQMLNLMNQYSGGGRGPKPTPKPTPLPTRNGSTVTQPTTVQRALKDNFLYNTPGTPEYVGKTKPAKLTPRQIMDKRLGMV